MLVRLVLIFAVVALAAPQDTFARTFYVRASGNNSNSGLTWAEAWAHPNKAQSALVAGDMLVIAPGSYDTVQFVPPAAGGAQTAYVCSTYTVNGSDAGRNNTFIRGGRAQALTWTSIGSNKWTATFASPMTGVSPRDFVALFRDGNVCDPRSSTTAANSQNEYAYNASTNVFTLYSTTNPNSSAWRVSWRPVMDTGPGQSNVLIFGLTIEEGSQRLIVVGDWDHSSPKPDSTYIKYCNLRKVIELEEFHNGAIILSQTNDPTTAAEWTNDLQVVGCTLSQISTVQFDQGIHAGAGIECYFVRDSRIDSNVFVGPMGSAIALKMGCYADNGVKSLNWSIKYNRISDCFDEAVWIGNKVGNLDFVGNIVERCEIGIDIHTSNPCGNDPTQGNIKVLNNTFVNNDVNFNASAANSIGGNQIKYNIFMDTSGAVSDNYVYTIGFRLRGGEAPLETPPTESYWANGINNNMYYYANGQTFMGWFSSNSGYSPSQPNWTQWKAAFDQSSISGVNPGFASSATGDYSRPASGSEINVTHSGATWTRYGAWQGSGSGCTLPGLVSLSTPANGATNLSVPLVFDWADLAGAINYEVQVDNNSDFSSPEVDQYSTTSGYTVANLTGISFNWRVRAQNDCGWGSWTSGRTFSIACTVPTVPTLAAPANGSSNLAQPVTLDWDDVLTSTGYQVQIDDNSDFSSVTVDQSVVASTYVASGLADGATFYWRVRAQNACGWGNWSTSRNFSTACNLPVAPNYVSPANGATGVAQPVALDWSDLVGATLYQVQVDDNSSFASTAIDQQVAASTYSAAGLTGGTLYYWRVRAQNACGWGSWTSARTFTPITADVTAPTISVVDATNITNNSALITWTTNEAASSQVNYGMTTSYGSSSTLLSSLVTSHEQLLSGLDSMTTYHFRVRSRDAAGNEAVSGDFTFTTPNNIGEGISPSVSSTYPGYSATAITDGNLDPFGGEASTWAAESATQPHWVELNFGTPRPVERIAVFWAWNTYQQAWMTSQQFRIQAWDGAAFNDVTTVTSSVVDSCTFVDITPTTTSRLRFYQPANQGPATYPAVVWLSELDVFGVPNAAPSLPTLSSPANAAQLATLTPTLVLNNSTDPEGGTITYDFQVSTSAAFSTIAVQALGVTQGAGGTTSWTVASNLTNGTTYYWRVRSYDGSSYSSYSSSRSFSVSVNTAPTVPTLASPIGGSQVGSFTPTLTINNSTDAEGNAVVYDFQVSTSATFSTITAQVSGVVQGAGSVSTWVVSTSLSNGSTYYWRARAYDGALYSNYSSNGSFVIGVNSAPSVPNLATPVAAGQVSTLTPTLTLTNSTDAEGNTLVYDFQVSTSTTFGTIAAQATSVAQGASGSTSWTVSPNLVNGTTYYWRARAYDGSLYSSYAAYRSFTVTANNAPAAPTLASPASGASFTSLAPILTLNNSADPDGDSLTYQFQIATSSAFTTIVAQISGVAPGSGTTSWTVTPNLSTGTTYYWRARAFDGSLASSYAAYRSFSIVANSAPTVPVLSSPAAAAQLTIDTPTLIVNNSTDANGDAITYSFQVATSSAFTTIVAQVSGVPQGTGTTSWIVTPSLSSGSTYYWRARAYDGALYSNYASYRTFSVNTNVAPGAPSPQLPLPNSRVIDFTPDLVANNATDPNNDALNYQFYLYNGAGTTVLAQSPMTSEGDTSTAWTTSITLAPKTSYSWRVRANDGQAWSSYSATRSFRTNRVPATPVPSAPIDGDTVIGSMHEYVVLNSTDPDDEPLTYDFEVFADSLLTTLIETVNGVTPGPAQTSAIQNADLVPNQYYWWRARASDSTHSSNWCEAEKFYQMQITLDITEAPSIVSPLDGSTVEHIQPSLIISWSGESDNSTICLFELATSETFNDLLLAGNVKGGGNTAVWAPDLVLSEGIYYWRAKRGESDYSKTASFSVVAPIYVSPNPFGYSEAGVVVHNLPAGSKFEVFTASGDQVAEIDNLSGDFNWDVRNSAGEKLGSGVFLWYVRMVDKTVSGKLIVQR